MSFQVSTAVALSVLLLLLCGHQHGVAASRSIHLDCEQHGQNLQARLDAFSSPDLVVLERCSQEDLGYWISYLARRSIPVYTLWIRTVKYTAQDKELSPDYCVPSAYGPQVIKVTDTLSALTGLASSLARCTTAHSLELAGNQLGEGVLSFQGGESVTKLNISTCNIKDLDGDVFADLRRLTHLDLSWNKLVKLETGLFRGSRKLEELHLQGNKISFITRQSFQGLRHLRYLDLSDNDLASMWLSEHVFSHLAHLDTLNLSSNRITELHATMFQPLHRLNKLDLSRNSISRIEDDAFLNQTRLETLSMSHNSVTSLSQRALQGLTSLRELRLDSCKISFVHQDAFLAMSSLEILDLRQNELGFVPDSLKHLGNLRQLNLSANLLTELASPLLLPNLRTLDLSENKIHRISEGYFSHLINLEQLLLSNNQMTSMSADLLSALDSLTRLEVAHNQLTDINGLFTTHSNLVHLNVSYNKLKWFDMAFIPKSLSTLAVQGNQVEELGNYYKMVDGFNLTTLDISDNLISELNENSFVESLEYVNLRGNNISDLGSGSFSGLRHLRLVDLRDNSLQTVPRTSIKTSPMSEAKPEFLVSRNPLVCDCELEWLSTYTPSSANSPGIISDHASLSCTAPLGADLPAVPVRSVPKDQFLCEYSSHCFSLCRCCTFLACDCRMKCPDPCNCFHDQAWNLNMIQCGGRNLTHVLREIPMDSTVLYLDDNNLANIGTEKFLGRNRLSNLFLNSSHVKEISNRTFLGLWGLRELHLEYNQIESVPADTFLECQDIQELYLHNNLIRFVDNGTFADMGKLRILTLHNNHLTTLQLNLPQTDSIRSLTLGRNQWECSCELSVFFQRVSDMTTAGAQRISHISCTDGLNSHSVLSFYSSCRDLDVLAVASKTSSSTLFILLISCTAGLLSLLAMSVLLVVKRKSLTRWIYSSGRTPSKSDDPSQYSPMLKLPSPEPLKTPGVVVGAGEGQVPSIKEYSAYLHYCLADDNYARNVLSARLEASGVGRSGRLCLHHRDLPKTCTVGQAIGHAVASSDCLLILASPAYFMSSIPSYELQMILSEVLPRHSSYPVIVAVSAASVHEVKARFAALAGCQSDTWIYLDVADGLFFDKVTALINTQGVVGGGNIVVTNNTAVSSVHDTSSESSSCSTKSTSASTLPARRVSTPRVIANPMDRFTPAGSMRGGDPRVLPFSANGSLLLTTTTSAMTTPVPVGESIYSTVLDPASDNEDETDPMYQSVYSTDGGQTVYIDRNLDLVHQAAAKHRLQAVASRFRTMQ